jgi:hypothetical protein
LDRPLGVKSRRHFCFLVVVVVAGSKCC